MSLITIRTSRTVPLEELTLLEATVLPEYQIEADSPDEALEELYWFVPIEDHSHFSVEVA